MNKLSIVLKDLRLRGGFTQSALSKESGVSQGALSKIENGLFVPSVETLHLLCQALGVKASDLVAMVYESLPVDSKVGYRALLGLNSVSMLEDVIGLVKDEDAETIKARVIEAFEKKIKIQNDYALSKFECGGIHSPESKDDVLLKK